MDFELTDEQRMIRDMARDFAESELAGVAAEIDETGEFPYETVKKMGELGLMGLTAPAEYGGVGADSVSYVLAVAEISKVCASHGVIMSVNNSLVNYGIAKFGTEEQKQKFLVPLATGEAIGAYSLTEPQSGSDAGNMRTVAVRDGDDYVINGLKSWVTSGPVAKYIVTIVTTDPKSDHRATMAVIADSGLPGFTAGKKEPKLGIRASATCELMFDEYRLPVAHRLGEEGEGFKIGMSILDAGRMGIAAQAIGIAEAAYEASVQYAQDRSAFGRTISEFEAIQFMLADMATKIDAASLLTYRAAWMKDRGINVTKESAMAKLFASEIGVEVADKALQIFGGYGYVKDFPAEKYYRDMKLCTIGEGTSEIQRLVIARELLKSL